MDCITTAVESFMIYHHINPMYIDYIRSYLKNGNYTIHTRTTPLCLDKTIAAQLITNIQEIQPNTITGIYIKPHETLNVYGYHYFYVDIDHIVSSWYTTRNITLDEYESLEHRPRSLSETSIENGKIEPKYLSLSTITTLWELIYNEVDDIGNDLYRLFGGTDVANQTLKKSECEIRLYMYFMDT